MTFALWLSWRYLTAKRKEALINVHSLFAVFGVAVGVAALITVIAVMTGFESDLKSRILKGQAHVLVMRHGGPFKNYQKVMETIESIDGVVAATPFIYTQVMIRSPGYRRSASRTGFRDPSRSTSAAPVV